MKEIKLTDLSYAYKPNGTGISDATAVYRPGIHLLMGPNGAGKTTLEKLMAGILVPQSGQCSIDGESMGTRRPQALAKAFYLAEDAKLPFDTIRETVKYHSPFYEKFSIERLEACLSAFGMTGNENLSHLSLGYRKKANLSYVLSLGVDALFLDEPLNGLDVEARQTFMRLLAAHVDDESFVFISTHSISEMDMIFDTVTFLKDGYLMLTEDVRALTSKLVFTTDDRPNENALYTVQTIDGYRSIFANPGGISTRVDFILLYMALSSDKNDTLLKAINKPGYEQ